MLLLRSRFRTITNTWKQTRMAEQASSQTSAPDQNQSTPLSSFLGSPRFFSGFLARSVSDAILISSATHESPTSILDVPQFCNYSNPNSNPFGSNKKNSNSPAISSYKHHSCQILSDGKIGLSLVQSLNGDDEEDGNGEDCDTTFSPKPSSKKVLFGAKLKVQVPIFSSSPDITPGSPGDFGIKTRNSQILSSPSPFGGSKIAVNSSCIRGNQASFSQERLSWSEMELSEEYTCVMTHGPNPKTTHIFDDTILGSCSGDGNLPDPKPKGEFDGLETNTTTINLASLPVDFMRFCYSCKVKLEDGKDIYMCRGEKAFCSHECRFQEMLIIEEEEAKNINLLYDCDSSHAELGDYDE